MLPVGYTVFNDYFIERRVLCMGISQAVKGLGIMIYPKLMQFLLNEYGFRRTIAILAAINAHAIFGMLVMHPVEWHYKWIEVPIEEDEPRNKFNYLLLI